MVEIRGSGEWEAPRCALNPKPQVVVYPPPVAYPPACSVLPEAVESELERICMGRGLAYPDPAARAALAGAGEAAALRIVRQIGDGRHKVRNFSAYIVHMAREEAMARNARGLATAESAACNSGPAAASRGEESISSPLFHGELGVEVESPSRAMASLLSNEARMEVDSPCHQRPLGLQNCFLVDVDGPSVAMASKVPNQVGMQMQNPSSGISLGLQNCGAINIDSPILAVAPLVQNSGGMESPSRPMAFELQNRVLVEADSLVRSMSPRVSNHVRVEVGSPSCYLPSEQQNLVEVERPNSQSALGPPRRGSTPSPVRDISMRVQRMAGLSGRMEVATPPSLGRMMPPMPAGDHAASNAPRETASPQMLALGELEFRKAFLILSYLRGQKLDLPVEYIQHLKFLSMSDFESAIWSSVGQRHMSSLDRRKNLDWDSNRTHVYHCHVEIERNSIVQVFKGPYLENTRTHLQKIVGDDNVLIVKFAGMSGDTNTDHSFATYCQCYHQVAEDGILLGLRRYRFFVYKDGGKEEKKKEKTNKEEKNGEENKKCTSSVKCYFVRTESGWDRDEPYILSNKTIDQARRLFMHVHTAPNVPKYMARFALILSKTIKLDVDLSTVNIVQIEDEPCMDEHGSIVLNRDGEPLIHTDGTGLISEDLALQCPISIFKGNFLNPQNLQNIVDCGGALMRIPSSKRHRSLIAEHPLLMQFRMFYDGYAVKGTVLVDKRLPPRTIHIRPSMIKIKTDPNISDAQCFNSLEIVSTSNRPKRALTSRFLITLLHYGGVPVNYFMALLENALEGIENTHCDIKDALEVAFKYADMDDSMPVQMILSGIPLDEPYLQSKLAAMTKQERKGLQQGRLPIDDCYYLMGTTDPTGILKPNEVCVILDNGQLSGDVLVYKHPGLHFGDIHVLTAVYIRDLEKIVGNSKYAIFFPTSGPRSLADEMANSDFDGDMYWVSRNPKLLEYFKPNEPWVQRITPKKTRLESPQHYGCSLERVLFHEFLRTRFTPSYAMGSAADCWMAYMDRLLTCEVGGSEKKYLENKILELVDIYYVALDAPKTGQKVEVPPNLIVKKYPHFMEKKGFPSYHSTSILGALYDRAISLQNDNVQSVNISLHPYFTEVEVSQACHLLWEKRYFEYLRESGQLCNVNSKVEKNIKFQKLYQKYKQMLYDADEFDESRRVQEEILHEACAIYQIVYGYAHTKHEVSKCCFAW